MPDQWLVYSTFIIFKSKIKYYKKLDEHKAKSEHLTLKCPMFQI